MNDRELYQQKQQARLDEWSAELDVLRAKASGASADARIELNEQIDSMEEKLDEGRDKLEELGEASEDRWESFKDGVDNLWDSLKSALSDLADRLRN